MWHSRSVARFATSPKTMTQKKSWTVLVYLAGDNNLDEAGVADLTEMKKVGSTDHLNIVAQVDRATAGVSTRRYYLRKGTTLSRDSVADLGETNMGDPAVLQDFLTWGMKKYPAERYLVVLWNHGNGWDDTDVYHVARKVVGRRITRSSGTPGAVSVDQVRSVGARFKRALFSTSVAAAVAKRGIAYDDNAQDFLDNLELKKVLESVAKTLGRKIDVVGMDACLMSMAEVLYQLRGAVGCTVGSEEVEPGDGWPYDKILGVLAKTPSLTGPQLALAVVKAYLASYGKNDNVTQSAFDLSLVTSAATAIDTLARALKTALAQPAARAGILAARTQVQTFDHGERDYIDLLDFCDLLDQHVAVPAVTAATKNARKVLNGNFLVATGNRGPDVAHAQGVSIYFPARRFSATSALTPLYATLDFTKHTVWDEFLVAYLNATSRR